MLRTRATACALLVALAIGMASPGTIAQAQIGPDPHPGGRVVFAMDFEPSGGLNPWLICCAFSSYIPQIGRILMPHAYVQQPDLTYVPDVLASEAEVTTDPFTITYRIKPEAVWNDGVPVSARDFVFTWRKFVDPDSQMFDRSGYDLIEAADVIDSKTVRFTFRRDYSDYKELFADVFPRHALVGKNFNRVWNRRIPISAGPFEFGEYVVGDHLTLVRNEDYWGEHLAYLDEVEFRFIPDPQRMIDALTTGEVDAMYPWVIDPGLAQLRSAEGVEFQTSAGPIWEHITLGFTNDLIRKPFIRRAIAHVIDRQTIVEEVVHPLRPEATVLDSLLLLTGEPGYEPHFDRYSHDPEKATQILIDHGCVKREDGSWRCNGKTVAFRYVTTSGNPLRKHLADLVKEQLEAFGIPLQVRRDDPATVFGPRVLVRTNFDLFNFAWIAGPLRFDRGVWSCDGNSNFSQYCNEDVGPLLLEADREFDPQRKSALVNQADAQLALDLPALPLYQKPTFLAYSSEVNGMVDNPSKDSPAWNIVDWWVEASS
jgi:peptide/nickel transport system substrate-binding protein